MIITSQMLGRSAGAVAIPTMFGATQPDTDWFFAPHMYGNPFQQILSERLGENGIAAHGVRYLYDSLPAINSSSAKHRVLHLHWLNVVLAGAKSVSDEEKRIAKFASFLSDVKSSDTKIVWTVHNVLPHEGYSEGSAVRVRELICEAADWIHIMSPTTVEECLPKFKIPSEKVIRVEHPGYHGFYPEVPSELDLRAKWGMPVGGKLVVILGGIKPYKGLAAFAQTFSETTQGDPRSLGLLIAGKANEPLIGTQLFDFAELSTNLHILPEMVSDSQVSELMTMADLVAIPYESSLNSGALVLALTYAKPVLARATAGSTHLLAGGAGHVYADDQQLRAALSDLSWIESAKPRAAELSRHLNRPHLTEVFAKTARVFVDSSVVEARQVAGGNGGLND